MSDHESLSIDISDHIATVTLLGPGKGNAMGPAFWREMPGAFERLDADRDVRVVLIRGSGSHFSYGLDLMAMMTDLGPLIQGPQMARGRTDFLNLCRRMQDAVTAVERCRKPVIAAISGWCIGGGVDLISACDIRICAADARFSVREVKLGMTADIGSLQRLPAIIGQGHTRELAMTGRDFDAGHAEKIGLVNAVHADADALFAAAGALAAEIAANPPLAVEGTKNVLNWSADHSVEAGLEYVAAWNSAFLQSKDLTEAVMAFMERRPPTFTGE